MGKNKLERFAEIDKFENVLELTDFSETQGKKPRGKWGREIFGNRKPIVLELACGKGSYTLELARRVPDKNFIGVDIKGARIWKGANRARQENLKNVRFLRIFIDHLDEYFAKDEVSEIWITFPDPFPKGSDREKRLTSDKFLVQYSKVLQSKGLIHLKTDSSLLYKFSKRNIEDFGGEILVENEDIHSADPLLFPLDICTDFEKKHLRRERTIKYLKFVLPTDDHLKE